MDHAFAPMTAGEADILDEVVAAEKAHTASSMEIRLGMEVSNLRSRNLTLDRLVHRYELELDQAGKELAAIRARMGDDGWRTMESAPRDGSRFLFWNGDRIGEGSYVSGQYFGAHGYPEQTMRNPTHWRPLPAPPVSEGGGA